MTRTYIENNILLHWNWNEINHAAWKRLHPVPLILGCAVPIVICATVCLIALLSNPQCTFLCVDRLQTFIQWEKIYSVFLGEPLSSPGRNSMLFDQLGPFRFKPQILPKDPLNLSKSFLDLVEPFLTLLNWTANVALSVAFKPCGSQKPKVSVPFFGVTVPSGIIKFSPSRGFWTTVALDCPSLNQFRYCMLQSPRDPLSRII